MLVNLALFIFLINICISKEETALFTGNAINLFANYGDLTQKSLVLSFYDEGDLDDLGVFWESYLPLFTDAKEIVNVKNQRSYLQIYLSETIEELLQTYFDAFHFEGTDKAWKVFMGDWNDDEKLKVLGINVDEITLKEDNYCCYALLKYHVYHKNVTLDARKLTVNDDLVDFGEQADFNRSNEIRNFTTHYGTHYINSYVLGDALFQVFVYKDPVQSRIFKQFRSALNANKHKKLSQRFIDYYFSSIFLKEIGDIKVTSGNKTVEAWAQANLLDRRYRYKKASILTLMRSNRLSKITTDLLKSTSGALLGLDLRLSTVIFKDYVKQSRFRGFIDNMLKLWEINS